MNCGKWSVNKVKEVMEISNRAKYDQNQQLKKELLDTGDKFWSNGQIVSVIV